MKMNLKLMNPRLKMLINPVRMTRKMKKQKKDQFTVVEKIILKPSRKIDQIYLEMKAMNMLLYKLK